MLDEKWLHDLAVQLSHVGGVVGVMLGGSRARGEHAAESDFDIGLYYRPPLNTAALGSLARRVGGSDAHVTEPGEWGPWVDGGAWLSVDGTSVDWIYRDLDRVQTAWAQAQQGQFAFNAQTGHPFGVPDFAYAGEVALGVVLDDPSGQLNAMQRQASTYPPALADALVERLWEADFLLGGLHKSAQRADSVWVVPVPCGHVVRPRPARARRAMAHQRKGRGHLNWRASGQPA